MKSHAFCSNSSRPRHSTIYFEVVVLHISTEIASVRHSHGTATLPNQNLRPRMKDQDRLWVCLYPGLKEANTRSDIARLDMSQIGIPPLHFKSLRWCPAMCSAAIATRTLRERTRRQPKGTTPIKRLGCRRQKLHRPKIRKREKREKQTPRSPK